MGVNGTIIVYPTAGNPPDSPDMTARCAIRAFECHGLLLPNTVFTCETPKPWIGRFADEREQGILAPEEYALYVVMPEQITPAMRDLVYLLDVDTEGRPAPIELPILEFSVTTKALPIVNGYDGRLLCRTWATVEFSYEDARYSEEIHRIRDPRHPVLTTLAEVFNSPVAWDVDVG